MWSYLTSSRKRKRSSSPRTGSPFSPLESFAPTESSPEFLYRILEKEDEMYDLYVRYAIEYICKVLFKDRKDVKIVFNKNEDDFSSIIVEYFTHTQRYHCVFNRLDELVEYLRDPKIELILLPLSIFKEDTGHQNLVVIDKVRQSVEFYDPNGASGHRSKYGNGVVDAVSLQWKTILLLNFLNSSSGVPTYNILEYEQTCPNYGLQQYEGIMPYGPRDIHGYCVLWTMFLIHLRIKYHKKDPIHTQTHYIQQLSDLSNLQFWLQTVFTSQNKTMDAVSQKFRSFLKNYTVYIFKEMEKYNIAEYKRLKGMARTRLQHQQSNIKELESRLKIFSRR